MAPGQRINTPARLPTIPADLVEQYDILHIQLFQLGVLDRDPEPIVQNLLRLLSAVTRHR